MSEFGRTVRQSGTIGTDHGHAGAMFVIGGSLKVPRTVLDRWLGLAPEQLYEGRDLSLTTDFRSGFSELAAKHLGGGGVAPDFSKVLGAADGLAGGAVSEVAVARRHVRRHCIFERCFNDTRCRCN